MSKYEQMILKCRLCDSSNLDFDIGGSWGLGDKSGFSEISKVSKGVKLKKIYSPFIKDDKLILHITIHCRKCKKYISTTKVKTSNFTNLSFIKFNEGEEKEEILTEIMDLLNLNRKAALEELKRNSSGWARAREMEEVTMSDLRDAIENPDEARERIEKYDRLNNLYHKINSFIIKGYVVHPDSDSNKGSATIVTRKV